MRMKLYMYIHLNHFVSDARTRLILDLTLSRPSSESLNVIEPANMGAVPPSKRD